jgi:hypothetical protein
VLAKTSATDFATGWVTPAGGGTTTPGPPQGRLTLQTGAPVMTTTQSAKTTIYYTPYVGNFVPIYDGASFAMTAFSELSVATTDTTKNPAAIGASKVNDWFVWSDAGTLRIGHGPDWTNDTTRSAGTALVRVNGIWLNNASITNGPAASRGTYVGTTRSNASSQLDWIYGSVGVGGVAGFFGVWNAFNRCYVTSLVGDSTDNWTYTSTTPRAANGSNTMRNSFVCGLTEDAFDAEYTIDATVSVNAVMVGICYDVTNAFVGRMGYVFPTSSSFVVPITASFSTSALGFHFFQAGEVISSAGATAAYYGDNGNTNLYQTGMFFKGWM